MKYLVTGGAGFIGSHIVEELLSRNETVRILDNFSTGRWENIVEFLDRVELIEGDIRSYHTVLKSVQGIDIVLHQAALPSVPRSILDPITTDEVNIRGTLNVLHCSRAAGVKRVVFASSSSVYGKSLELPLHERLIPDPMSPYAITKLTGEKYCQTFSRIYELETICLRYFNVFGRRQNPNSQYSAVIPKFIKAIMSDRRPIIYGDGSQSRDFTYVSNIVSANILAATAGIENISATPVINIAGHQQTQVLTLAHLINEILGKNVSPVFEHERVGEVRNSYADISLARKTINYTPRIDFQEGLRLTIESYQKNPVEVPS